MLNIALHRLHTQTPRKKTCLGSTRRYHSELLKPKSQETEEKNIKHSLIFRPYYLITSIIKMYSHTCEKKRRRKNTLTFYLTTTFYPIWQVHLGTPFFSISPLSLAVAFPTQRHVRLRHPETQIHGSTPAKFLRQVHSILPNYSHPLHCR